MLFREGKRALSAAEAGRPRDSAWVGLPVMLVVRCGRPAGSPRRMWPRRLQASISPKRAIRLKGELRAAGRSPWPGRARRPAASTRTRGRNSARASAPRKRARRSRSRAPDSMLIRGGRRGEARTARGAGWVAGPSGSRWTSGRRERAREVECRRVLPRGAQQRKRRLSPQARAAARPAASVSTRRRSRTEEDAPHLCSRRPPRRGAGGTELAGSAGLLEAARASEPRRRRRRSAARRPRAEGLGGQAEAVAMGDLESHRVKSDSAHRWCQVGPRAVALAARCASRKGLARSDVLGVEQPS